MAENPNMFYVSSSEFRTTRVKSICVFAGIGYETAKRLSYMGAKVILACRDEAKAQAVSDQNMLMFHATSTHVTKPTWVHWSAACMLFSPAEFIFYKGPVMRNRNEISY